MVKVSAIHDERGYRTIRSELARAYDVSVSDPNIQVVGAALRGDRTLTLAHRRHCGVPLDERSKGLVLSHIERLWGHSVVLEEVDE
jgi:spore cortex formation protein SpoVR/YcgB (stage V sporulation)